MIFKGQQLFVSASLGKELLLTTDVSHIGFECIQRAHDSLYWPRMLTDLKEYNVNAMSAWCIVVQSKKPTQQHDFVARPWSKVAVDLCNLDRRTLLVISDYYSNYIKVALLH